MSDEFVVLRQEDFRRMTEPRAMNYATAELLEREWNLLAITDRIVTLRSELILDQATDQMYVWADTTEGIWMDCPDLACEDAIFLGNTPSLALIKEAAREHVRERHAGGPIVLRMEPEQPVLRTE